MKMIPLLSLFSAMLLTVPLAAGETDDLVRQLQENAFAVLEEPLSLTSELVVPEAATLVFGGNGRLIRQEGGKLTVHGSIQAAPVRIFENFADDQIDFAASTQPQVYPQWWGAKGDGRNDDSDALQAAIRSGAGRIAIPHGRYLATRTLNCTDRSQPPLTISGTGHGLAGGSQILAQTGGILFDATGSPNFMLESLTILGAGPDASTVGVLLARSNNHKFVEFSTFRDLTINLAENPKANGGVGSIGIYSVAAEIWRAHNIVVIADNPVVLTATDLYGIQSENVEFFTEYTSNSQVAIDGASSLIGFNGPALTVAGMAGLSVNDVYFNRWGGGPDADPFAVRLVGLVHRFTLTGHLEGYRQLLDVRGVAEDMTVSFTSWRLEGNVDPWIVLNGDIDPAAAIRTSRLIAKNYNPTDAPHPLIAGRGKQLGGLSNCSIQLYRGQSLEVESGSIFGNIIQADFPAPRLNLQPTEGVLSYQLLDPNGITMAGPVQHIATPAPAAPPTAASGRQAETGSLFGGTPIR